MDGSQRKKETHTEMPVLRFADVIELHSQLDRNPANFQTWWWTQQDASAFVCVCMCPINIRPCWGDLRYEFLQLDGSISETRETRHWEPERWPPDMKSWKPTQSDSRSASATSEPVITDVINKSQQAHLKLVLPPQKQLCSVFLITTMQN